MGYPLDYPLELDSPEHYVFESEDLEDEDIIPIGSTVRSYDFVVGKHILRDDCYFEGVIEKFEPVPTCSPNCNHYIVRTTKILRNGEEEDIVEGSNDYFSTHWNNYGVIPLEIVEPEVMESEWFNEMKFVEHYPMESHGFEWRGYTYQDGDISISVDGPNGIISYDDKLEKELPKKVAKNYLTDNGIPFERLERGDYNLFYFTFPNNGETCYQHDWMGNECRYCNFRMSLNRAESFEAETYTPPAAAVTAAKKGLSQRKKWGRGGLSPAEAKSQGIDSGVTRARKIASGKVSRHDVRRMSAFNRHRKNNKPSKKMPDGGPTAGTIAWNLWGGSAGVNWAKKKSAAMNAESFDAEVRKRFDAPVKDNYALAGYLIADGTDTKIAISKETLNNYTKEEVREFVQSEINNSDKYIKAWYFENFRRCMDHNRIMAKCKDCYDNEVLRVRWAE